MPIYDEQQPSDEQIIQRLDNLYDMIRNGLRAINLATFIIAIIEIYRLIK